MKLTTHTGRSIPAAICGRVCDALDARGKGVAESHVLVLGVSEAAGDAAVREALGVQAIRLLQREGAIVIYHDPRVAALRCGPATMVSTPLSIAKIRAADCVLLLGECADLALEWVTGHAQLLVDARVSSAEVHAARRELL